MKRLTGLREIELIERLEWFILLRWATVAFIITAAVSAELFFHISLPLSAVVLTTAFIALYNIFLWAYLRRIKKSSLVVVDLPSRALRMCIVQALLDIGALFFLIHLLGGVENPFIFYFIFHTVISSTLLPKRWSYAQAFTVSSVMGFIVFAEYRGIIEHHSLGNFVTEDLYRNPRYVTAVFIVFSSSIIFTTFIATSISEKLRRRELELALRTRELERANSALREKDRLKSEYVRMVAHDIKSPLSTVSSLLQTVIEGYAGSIDQRARGLIERAQAKVDFLHHYAKDLLDLSRLRSKEGLNPEPIDVRELVEEALKISAPKGEGKNISIDLHFGDGMPPLVADKEQMLHVLINLISNSLKYTPEGGAIRIEAEHRDDRFILRVSDTGIGIPEDDIPRIFDEFYRASNVAGTTRGTGLGLALVKDIVHRHGGRVEVESTPGQGTTFTVTLPVKVPERV